MVEIDLGEKECAESLREARWSQGVICLYCSSTDVVKNGVREDHIQQYRCKSCGKCFNDRTGTVFAETQMGLDECLHSIEKQEEGESINQISKELGRSWKTVSDFLRKNKTNLDTSSITLKIEKNREESHNSIKDAEKDFYSKMGC